MKALRNMVIVLCILLIGAAAWLWYEYDRFARQPAGSQEAFITVSVSANETFTAVAQRLMDSGIIKDVFRFKLLARIKGDDKRLKAGEYRLSTIMTPLEVLDAMVSGKVLLHRLTIPEGYTIREIAMELRRTGLADGSVFESLAMDPVVARELGVQGSTLEGYLFPDTYFFPKGVTPMAIMTQAVNHFHDQFRDEWRQRARELGMTVHQIVTLASIIEKETGEGAERPIIASVFHNRLKKSMRLESDPTVIYGIKDFDGNITRRHLSQHTPYNTYVIRGLPPGPIANPGYLALEAALYPAQTEYLFFVSKKDGTHYFSKTIEEHNRAIRKYQLRRRNR